MLSTRPEKSVGSHQIWEDATATLVAALEELGMNYSTDEKEVGLFMAQRLI
jgi:threonyl-tRNA synthetase